MLCQNPWLVWWRGELTAICKPSLRWLTKSVARWVDSFSNQLAVGTTYNCPCGSMSCAGPVVLRFLESCSAFFVKGIRHSIPKGSFSEKASSLCSSIFDASYQKSRRWPWTVSRELTSSFPFLLCHRFVRIDGLSWQRWKTEPMMILLSFKQNIVSFLCITMLSLTRRNHTSAS